MYSARHYLHIEFYNRINFILYLFQPLTYKFRFFGLLILIRIKIYFKYEIIDNFHNIPSILLIVSLTVITHGELTI